MFSYPFHLLPHNFENIKCHGLQEHNNMGMKILSLKKSGDFFSCFIVQMREREIMVDTKGLGVFFQR